MNKVNIKGALIGCGYFANNHMHAWTHIEGVEITALCDLEHEKAQAMADDFNVQNVHSDFGAMLKQGSFDFVDVVTTAQSHRAIVELACEHVRLVICQKPFAERMDDALAMVAAANKANTLLIIHENFRWQKAFITMKRLINQGRIGDPHFARFSFRHGYDNYKNQPYLADIERFAIMDVGLHLFDLARHFMGEVARVSCTTQRINPIVRGEDMFTALLAHQSGTTSICECSFFARIEPEPFPQTLAWIEGDKGTLELGADYQLKIHGVSGYEVVNTEPPVPEWGEQPWHNVQDSVLNFQRHAMEVYSGKVAPQPSGSDNLKTLALALAAYEAADTGTTIDMKQWKPAAS